MDYTIPIARDRRLTAWLATLGYDVACPTTATDLFAREAAQWGLGPHELACLVRTLFCTDPTARRPDVLADPALSC